jgi:hypothetical protein
LKELDSIGIPPQSQKNLTSVGPLAKTPVSVVRVNLSMVV